MKNYFNEKFSAVVGINESKEDIVIDWSSVYSVLVSGTVGSGKTNFVRNVLLSLIERNPEEDIKIAIFDSKGVDYEVLGNSEYILWPIVSSIQDFESVLLLTSTVVESRLEQFKGFARDIDTYNRAVGNEKKRLPRIFVVLDGYDEVVNSPEPLRLLTNILKRNEGTGVHVILVTSTITKKTIEPIRYLINCNVGFAASTMAYSQMAIGMKGAERLKYPGGFIFRQLNSIVQGETILIDDYSKRLPVKAKSVEHDYELELKEKTNIKAGEPIDEDLLGEAIEFVTDAGKASISMLQRRFMIDYDEALRLMNKLEEMDIVVHQKGSSPRIALKSKVEKGSSYIDYSAEPEQKKTIELDFTDAGGENKYYYKFYVEDVERVIYHRKKLFRKPYLEIVLKQLPLEAKSGHASIEKEHIITSPYLRNDMEERKMKSIGYGIASDADLSVEFE